jgi:3-oxoacyl-(acyl-carrier-protein) synthase
MVNSFKEGINVAGMVIRGLKTLSAVGIDRQGWRAAFNLEQAPCKELTPGAGEAVFPLNCEAQELVDRLLKESRYGKLDRSVLLAIAAARLSLKELPAGFNLGVVSLGSSRGPTTELERSITRFDRREGRLSALTSPITTAGNLSSWVAQECFSFRGLSEVSEPVALSTSMTCSSAFNSLLVAISFIKSGMAEAGLLGGAESCLTPYTVAQLKALRLYGEPAAPWPARPLYSASDERNWVALGEAAGTALVLPAEVAPVDGDLQLLGVGWALEEIASPTGISAQGLGFERAMQKALAQLPEGIGVDVVIAHAPGSVNGDNAELSAIERVLGDVMVCTSKHLTGHTYGASGMVSLSLAQALLTGVPWPGLPYPNRAARASARAPRAILINTAGFGGNVLSVIIASSR